MASAADDEGFLSLSLPSQRQPRPIRREPRRQPLLHQPPNREVPNAARADQHQAAASKATVDGIHRLHEAGSVFGHVGGQIQRELLTGDGLQVHQHHAGFGVLVAGAVDVFQVGAGRLGDVGDVTGGARQGDAGTAAVLGVFSRMGLVRMKAISWPVWLFCLCSFSAPVQPQTSPSWYPASRW